MDLIYLLIFKLFILILGEDSGENIEHIDIKEGITKYSFYSGQVKTFQFTAIEDGYYLITFTSFGFIIEATGNVHQDTSLFEEER